MKIHAENNREKFINSTTKEYVENLITQVVKDGLEFKNESPTLPSKMPEKNGWKLR